MAKKLTSILLGWWFWITNRNNELAQIRLSVCAKCEHRRGMVCGECTCVLQAKARMIEEDCPLKKWPHGVFKDGGSFRIEVPDNDRPMIIMSDRNEFPKH